MIVITDRVAISGRVSILDVIADLNRKKEDTSFYLIIYNIHFLTHYTYEYTAMKMTPHTYVCVYIYKYTLNNLTLVNVDKEINYNFRAIPSWISWVRSNVKAEAI